MEVSDQLDAPAALLPGKDTPYPLDRRLSGPQGQSERGVAASSLYRCFISPAHARCWAHSMHLDLIYHEIWSSSLCSFLHLS